MNTGWAKGSKKPDSFLDYVEIYDVVTSALLSISLQGNDLNTANKRFAKQASRARKGDTSLFGFATTVFSRKHAVKIEVVAKWIEESNIPFLDTLFTSRKYTLSTAVEYPPNRPPDPNLHLVPLDRRKMPFLPDMRPLQPEQTTIGVYDDNVTSKRRE